MDEREWPKVSSKTKGLKLKAYLDTLTESQRQHALADDGLLVGGCHGAMPEGVRGSEQIRSVVERVDERSGRAVGPRGRSMACGDARAAEQHGRLMCCIQRLQP